MIDWSCGKRRGRFGETVAKVDAQFSAIACDDALGCMTAEDPDSHKIGHQAGHGGGVHRFFEQKSMIFG